MENGHINGETCYVFVSRLGADARDGGGGVCQYVFFSYIFVCAYFFSFVSLKAIYFGVVFCLLNWLSYYTDIHHIEGA